MVAKKESSVELCNRATVLGNTIAIRMLEYLSTSKHQVHGFIGLATDFVDLCRVLWSLEAGLTDANHKHNQFPADVILELDKRFRQVHDEFIVLNQMVVKFVDHERKSGKLFKGFRMMFADTDVEKMRQTLCRSRDALKMSAMVFRWSLGDAKADASMSIGYTGLVAALDRMNGTKSNILPPLPPPPTTELPEPPIERQPTRSITHVSEKAPSHHSAPTDDHTLSPSLEPSNSWRHPSARSSEMTTSSVRDTVYQRAAMFNEQIPEDDDRSDITSRSRRTMLEDEMQNIALHDQYNGTHHKADAIPVTRWAPRQMGASRPVGGRAGLLNAVQQRNYKTLEHLLDSGIRADNKPEAAGLLRIAAQNRDPESMSLLLSYGADANGIDKEGFSPLLTVTQIPFFEGARVLLKHGADPNLSAGPESESPLAVAAAENKIDLVQLYLAHGGDPNFVMMESGDTALVHAMSKTASIQVLELLLKAGGDPNSKNGEGTTALFQAIQTNRVDLMAVLLDHGANPNLPAPKHPLWPSTYKPKALQLLLNRGGDPKKAPGIMELASSLKKLESIQILMKAGVSPNIKKDGVYTPLCSAIRDNSAHIVSYLLENGADPNLPASEYPAFKCLTHHRTHFLPQLVAAGADLHNPKGIIEAAVKNDEKEALMYLLGQGVSPNDKSPEGHTALTTAISEGRGDYLDLLLANGADPAIRGKDWPICMAVNRPDLLRKLLPSVSNPRAFRGVLEMAVHANQLESIKLLLQAGVSVEDKNCGVFSPLTTAIREERKDIVRYLLDEANADPNAPGEHLPIVKALRRYDGHDTEIIQMLLTRGAEINKMHRGWNAVLQSVENGDAKILKLLIDMGGPIDLQVKDESGIPVVDIVTERGWEEGLSLLFPNANARQSSLSLDSWRWLTASISRDQQHSDGNDASDCSTMDSGTLPGF